MAPIELWTVDDLSPAPPPPAPPPPPPAAPADAFDVPIPELVWNPVLLT